MLILFLYNKKKQALEASTTYTGNVVISSLSIKLLLAVLNEGVPQNTFTADELRRVLGFSNITEIRSRFGELLSVAKVIKKIFLWVTKVCC